MTRCKFAVLLAVAVTTSLLVTGCVDPPKRATPLTVTTSTTTTVPLADRLVVEARSATLRIRSTSSCEGVGVGSGFVIAGSRVITNRHVVNGAKTLTIEEWDGTAVTANTANQGTWADLAVIGLRTGSSTHLSLAPRDAKVGTRIHVFGYPGGRELTVTNGKVLSYRANASLGNLGQIMHINAKIEPGNSGGPVVNDGGQVVGVVYATEVATGDGLAVPASTLSDVMSDPHGFTPETPCSGFFGDR